MKESRQPDYRAIVERIAVILHGKVTDIDLLSVTVQAMKERNSRLESQHEKQPAPVDMLTAAFRTAPPAPSDNQGRKRESMVVPDAIPETESEDGNDIDYMEPSAIYALGKTHGWHDCRDTILQKPGAGWIPCSERMPEEIGRYWCYVEEQNSLGKSHYQWNCSWNGDEWGGEALSGRVTHWMPLPAAPGKEG